MLQAARDRWHKSADLNAVRGDIDGLIQSSGGVASLDELATQLLAARGSTLDDERERKRCAYAVLRAAVELEASVAPVRFEAYAEARRPDRADAGARRICTAPWPRGGRLGERGSAAQPGACRR